MGSSRRLAPTYSFCRHVRLRLVGMQGGSHSESHASGFLRAAAYRSCSAPMHSCAEVDVFTPLLPALRIAGCAGADRLTFENRAETGPPALRGWLFPLSPTIVRNSGSALPCVDLPRPRCVDSSTRSRRQPPWSRAPRHGAGCRPGEYGRPPRCHKCRVKE